MSSFRRTIIKMASGGEIGKRRVDRGDPFARFVLRLALSNRLALYVRWGKTVKSIASISGRDRRLCNQLR